MDILLYEDEHVVDLYPITLTRAAFAVPVGGIRLYEMLRRTFPGAKISYRVRDLVRTRTQRQFPNRDVDESTALQVNARAVPSLANMRRISGEEDGLELISYPHETIIWHKRICPENFDHFKSDGAYQEIEKGVYVGKNVTIHAPVAFDCSPGPVIIEDETEIFPFSCIEGPVLIGKQCKIMSHSTIHDRVHIGDVCKIRGEVTESVVMPFSNKQHYGFLGNAFVGEWVNLGAGTCNSDLKNTYGDISVKMGNTKIETGEQFLGCVIGDFSKTAINTSIFTGKSIGVNSFLYGIVDEDIPSFVNHMKYLGGKSCVFYLEKAIDTQRRMFARRSKTQESDDIEILRRIFDLTATERDSFLEAYKNR